MTNVAQQTGSDKAAIRPFHVNVPEAELTELRERINATKWPDRETVKDQEGGHFAAWEQPKLFAEEVRAGFRPLQWNR